MTAPSANQSLHFALQREFLKLYGVAFFGWILIVESPSLFYAIRKEWIRNLITLPLVLLGVILMVGGIVGVLYRFQKSQLPE